jgi:hypothetical protein
MRTLRLVAVASLMLCVGCPRATVLPDERIPHQLAEEAPDGLVVWCHDPKDTTKWVKCRVRAQAGWWIASPQVVDPP